MNKIIIVIFCYFMVFCKSQEDNNELEFNLSEFGNGKGFNAQYSIVDCLNLHEEIDWEFRKIGGIKNFGNCVRICEESWCGSHCLELGPSGNQIWDLEKCSITLENNNVERNFQIKSIGPCGMYPGRNVLTNTCQLNKSSTVKLSEFGLFFLIIIISIIFR